MTMETYTFRILFHQFYKLIDRLYEQKIPFSVKFHNQSHYLSIIVNKSNGLFITEHLLEDIHIQ